jgi:ferredoxin-NADP reductase
MNLPPEAQISIEGPYGDFALHEDQIRPAVFLAGGIGITPFLSIISDASKRGLLHKLFLFYSNRSPEEAAFRSELIELEKQNSKFKFIETITDTKHSPWNGEKGYINQEMILKHIKTDVLTPIYYVAGSPSMVLAMTSFLKDLGVKDEDLRASSFLGY